MKLQIKILLIATSLMLYACPDYENEHKYITFVNKTDKPIAYQEMWSATISPADTILADRIGLVIIKENTSSLIANSSHKGGWETDLRGIPYIQFLVTDGDTYMHYLYEPWDTIRKYVPILHCYQLTLEDLQRMNWTVVYPPEE